MSCCPRTDYTILTLMSLLRQTVYISDLSRHDHVSRHAQRCPTVQQVPQVPQVQQVCTPPRPRHFVEVIGVKRAVVNDR